MLDASSLPPDSFARLDAAVKTLVKEYTAAQALTAETGQEDWRQYAYFNKIRYVRNLVDANEDFELMVTVPVVPVILYVMNCASVAHLLRDD